MNYLEYIPYACLRSAEAGRWPFHTLPLTYLLTRQALCTLQWDFDYQIKVATNRALHGLRVVQVLPPDGL